MIKINDYISPYKILQSKTMLNKNENSITLHQVFTKLEII